MIFNKIRIAYGEVLERFKPILRNAYQSIYHYQLDRTTENESQMREAINATREILEFFANHLPYSKAKYILALKRSDEMAPFDLIMCFDQAIFEMHVWETLSELRIKQGQWAKNNTWSKELRDLLNERQVVRHDDSNLNVEEEFLVSGTPASRGSAQGRACIALDKEDFHQIQRGDILVTTMTTPEFIEVAHLISGLITDRGGIVCHAAILAREFNIPCIVGCQTATTTIKNGDQIRLDAISGIVVSVIQ
ncbi:PEP-utilizing enzyme [Paenibacillus mendelii]|uniref:PEP-utilizing enzyme n=1 Tax=Paenibacillus mendelii TaxID=206163 RepID=A0ABV6J1W6_9BACL|nr:PEP-utilizing enzyme [Paenibacillus mendelii]MCQ6562802.1 PEP-utilizing enzyme [Paenibacillus mendelii]